MGQRKHFLKSTITKEGRFFNFFETFRYGCLSLRLKKNEYCSVVGFLKLRKLVDLGPGQISAKCPFFAYKLFNFKPIFMILTFLNSVF